MEHNKSKQSNRPTPGKTEKKGGKIGTNPRPVSKPPTQPGKKQ